MALGRSEAIQEDLMAMWAEKVPDHSWLSRALASAAQCAREVFRSVLKLAAESTAR